MPSTSPFQVVPLRKVKKHPWDLEVQFRILGVHM